MESNNASPVEWIFLIFHKVYSENYSEENFLVNVVYQKLTQLIMPES